MFVLGPDILLMRYSKDLREVLETISHGFIGLGITILPKMASISSISDDGIKLLNF